MCGRLVIPLAILAMAATGCGGSDSPGTGPRIELVRVDCSSGDEAQTLYRDGLEDVLETVHAFAHDTQYRQEQVRQVPITVTMTDMGAQVTAACSGASFVEFVQEVWQ